MINTFCEFTLFCVSLKVDINKMFLSNNNSVFSLNIVNVSNNILMLFCHFFYIFKLTALTQACLFSTVCWSK